MCGKRTPRFVTAKTSGLRLALIVTGYEKWVNLAQPQFCGLSSGEKNTSIQTLFRRKEKVHVKCFIKRKHGLHRVSSPVSSLLWLTLADPLQ